MSNAISLLRDSDTLNSMLRYNSIGSARVREIMHQYASSDLAGKEHIRSNLLQTTIRDAQKTEYGRAFGSAIEDWPVLTKDRLREHAPDFRGPSLFHLTAGTGGTTGSPIRLFRSLKNIAIERCFIEQLIVPYGYSLKSSKVAILRADEIKDPSDVTPPFSVHKFSKRHLILSNPHLTRDTVGWYLDAIRQHGTEVLYVYPSMLENLIHLAKKASLSLHVPVVLSSSETVSPTLFDEVRETLGGILVDYYGLGERVALASARIKQQYYFHPTYGYAELHDNGELPDEKHAFYRIVATGFWNSAMPLVRYDTGDIAIVRKEDANRLSEIVAGELPFAGIRGRNSEFVLGRNGARISGLNHLPRGVDNLVRIQVIQESLDHLEIRLRVTDNFSSADLNQLQENLRAMIPPSTRIDIAKNLELEKAGNGKTPFVIRRIS